MKYSIPHVSRPVFERRLQTLAGEDITVIRAVESILRKKRGHVFSMPKPGTPVILLVSGGIDSTVAWGQLLSQYKLHVYPLFLHRGRNRKRKELRAVQYFSKLFQSRFPDLYHPPKELSTHLPPPELEKAMEQPDYYHPARILDSLNVERRESYIVSQNGLPFTFPFYAVAYAKYLFDNQNIDIRTIFNAVTGRDGIMVYSQTFTALRLTQLCICTVTNDYRWQFASLPFEKDLGHWFTRAQIIRIGHNLNLPLELTWSCYRAGRYQCGNRCLTCQSRRQDFREAGVADRTKYETEYAPSARIKLRWKSLTKRHPILYSVHTLLRTIKKGVTRFYEAENIS